MTHTLHRKRGPGERPGDYIVFCMAAQKRNSEGASQKLLAMLDVLAAEAPCNVGDDNRGGVLTGLTLEEIRANAGDKAYMAGVYTSLDQVKAVLLKLKELDTGMSVVVTGDFEEVFRVARSAGLEPHTVNMSLGTFGKKDLLPREPVLEITTMCGHSMVCPDHVEHVMDLVRKGKMTAGEAARDLARPCTCAMFNPDRAESIISRECVGRNRECS